MSENALDNSEEGTRTDELSVLKDKARMMGITFSNNIGVDALRQKINEKLDGKNSQEDQGNGGAGGSDESADGDGPAADADVSKAPNPLADPVPTTKAGKVRNLRQFMRDEQMKLVRIRVQCLNPKKRDLQGEFFTIANEYLGNVRKFVPFTTEANEDGWHVPYCIYTHIKSRQFLNVTVTKDKRTGTSVVGQRLATEFAVELLDPLTPKELKDLAAAQLARGATSGDDANGLG